MNLGELLKNAPATPKADAASGKSEEPEQKIDPDFEAAVEAENAGREAEQTAPVAETPPAEAPPSETGTISLKTSAEGNSQAAAQVVNAEIRAAQNSPVIVSQATPADAVAVNTDQTARAPAVSLVTPRAANLSASPEQTNPVAPDAEQAEQSGTSRVPPPGTAQPDPRGIRVDVGQPAANAAAPAATTTPQDISTETPELAENRTAREATIVIRPVSAARTPRAARADDAARPATSSSAGTQPGKTVTQSPLTDLAREQTPVQAPRDADAKPRQRSSGDAAPSTPRIDAPQPIKQAPLDLPAGQATAQSNGPSATNAAPSALQSAQALSAEGAAPQSGASTSGTAPQTSLPPASTAPALAERGLVHQIVAAAGTRANGGVVEVFLDPPELGRVEIIMEIAEQGVRAVLAAERASTGDLIRKHSDLLQQQLEDAGFADVDLSFAEQDASGPGFDLEPSAETGELTLEGREPDAAHPARRTAQAGLVDLRL